MFKWIRGFFKYYFYDYFTSFQRSGIPHIRQLPVAPEIKDNLINSVIHNRPEQFQEQVETLPEDVQRNLMECMLIVKKAEETITSTVDVIQNQSLEIHVSPLLQTEDEPMCLDPPIGSVSQRNVTISPLQLDYDGGKTENDTIEPSELPITPPMIFKPPINDCVMYTAPQKLARCERTIKYRRQHRTPRNDIKYAHGNRYFRPNVIKKEHKLNQHFM